MLADGTPISYDPAVYYGDREAEIVMTRVFGGFGPEFLAAYEHAWPLEADAGLRRDLYNLYHVLNHRRLKRGTPTSAHGYDKAVPIEAARSADDENLVAGQGSRGADAR